MTYTPIKDMVSQGYFPYRYVCLYFAEGRVPLRWVELSFRKSSLPAEWLVRSRFVSASFTDFEKALTMYEDLKVDVVDV